MDISNAVKIGTRLLGKSGLKVQKYSPEILVGVGIAGLITAGILAARSTRGLDDVLIKHDEHRETADFFLKEDNDYTEVQHRQDLNRILKEEVIDLVKMYGPAVTLGVVSVVSILGGHHVLKQRNIALAAAYKLIEASYSEYRKRVSAEVGEGRELEIYRGQEVETKTVGGKRVTKIKDGQFHGSPYAMCFDQVNTREWTPFADMNLTLILSVQRMANLRLQTVGYVFLNDVYEDLGFEKTPAGQIVGWLYDREKTGGDGWIDFGLDEPTNEMARMFLRGDEAAVWLDFNVDGPIFELI